MLRCCPAVVSHQWRDSLRRRSGSHTWPTLWLRALLAKQSARMTSQWSCLRQEGVPLLTQLATLAVATVQDGLPLSWRGGKMIPVPRKPGRPLSGENARGILLSNHIAKVFGKVLRQQVASPFAQLVKEWQYGAVAGGGIEYPAHAVRLFLAQAHCMKFPAAIIFADLKAAFYRVWPEFALGPLLGTADREALLARSGIPCEMLDRVRTLLTQEDTVLRQQGVNASGVTCSLIGMWAPTFRSRMIHSVCGRSQEFALAIPLRIWSSRWSSLPCRSSCTQIWIKRL